MLMWCFEARGFLPVCAAQGFQAPYFTRIPSSLFSAAGDGRQTQGALKVREEGKEWQWDGKQNWRDRAQMENCAAVRGKICIKQVRGRRANTEWRLKEMGSENKNQVMLSVTSGILRVSEKGPSSLQRCWFWRCWCVQAGSTITDSWLEVTLWCLWSSGSVDLWSWCIHVIRVLLSFPLLEARYQCCSRVVLEVLKCLPEIRQEFETSESKERLGRGNISLLESGRSCLGWGWFQGKISSQTGWEKGFGELGDAGQKLQGAVNHFYTIYVCVWGAGYQGNPIPEPMAWTGTSKIRFGLRFALSPKNAFLHR